ncbi:MAG: glycosyltransferase [Burkholderiaceae bacterium]|nr:glycosyltransferase [Burkholderiaceae bacterium]
MTAEVQASVLIPVKNGGALLGEVLDAVLAQEARWPFEVIVMDSGSTDGSVECARRRGVRVECIAPAEFGHGKTRNRLAALASGKFLVFITQDAKPADRQWLTNLVQGCDADPSVAGAFGAHLAYPQARYVTRRELEAHFAGFGQALSVVRLEDADRFSSDAGYRQWLHFFSSNNACLRRSVWERLPFPDVAFSEDQTWALRAIEQGYAKAYVPDARVYHSHDFGIWETLQRNFDEARSFRKYFGYELQGGLAQALRCCLGLARRDWQWLKTQPGRRGGKLLLLPDAMYMGLIEAARVLGQYLGTHHQRLPGAMQRLISRDQLLQTRG